MFETINYWLLLPEMWLIAGIVLIVAELLLGSRCRIANFFWPGISPRKRVGQLPDRLDGHRCCVWIADSGFNISS
jgi:hypothetical protein